jgi:hypothetical protein
MNKSIMRAAGFSEQVKAVENGKCPFCAKAIDGNDPKEFRDERSKREFRISGLCQKCQDEFFGTGE